MIRRSAFTLIELLIVIAIIGVLIAAVAVAVTKAKEIANHSDQNNNMRNIVMACRTSETANDGRLPPARGLGWWPRSTCATTRIRQRTANLFTHSTPPTSTIRRSSKASSPRTPTWGQKSGGSRCTQPPDPSLPSDTTRYTSFVANVRVFSSFASSHAYNAPVVDGKRRE